MGAPPGFVRGREEAMRRIVSAETMVLRCRAPPALAALGDDAPGRHLPQPSPLAPRSSSDQPRRAPPCASRRLGEDQAVELSRLPQGTRFKIALFDGGTPSGPNQRTTLDPSDPMGWKRTQSQAPPPWWGEWRGLAHRDLVAPIQDPRNFGTNPALVIEGDPIDVAE